MKALIVLDLEFNTGMYGVALEEVLQIGAVHIDRPGGVVDGTFSAFIRPSVHKRFSPYARLLPEFERSLQSRLDFETAYYDFLRWCSGETEFAEWGRGDFAILARNAIHHGLPIDELPTRYIDIQSAFSRELGQTDSIQLFHAVEYCRIPETFVFHDALNDSLYAALVAGFVDRERLRSCEVEITDRELHPIIKPKRPKKTQYRLGPFNSRESALGNMGSRRAACPECSKVMRISAWQTEDKQYYYSEFTCPEHGRFIRRLQLIRQPDGHWWTYNDVLKASPENDRRLARASGGEAFQCRPRRQPGSRHRRKRK